MVLAGCLPGTGKVSQKPRAVDGVLDLSAWNFERDGTTGLDGGMGVLLGGPVAGAHGLYARKKDR